MDISGGFSLDLTSNYFVEMSSEKQPLIRPTSPSSRDPFVINALNSGPVDHDVEDMKYVAQHARYKYYTKLHHKEKLVWLWVINCFHQNLSAEYYDQLLHHIPIGHYM